MAEELAAKLLGIEFDKNWDQIDSMLLEQYGINLDNFENLVELLLPMIEIASSPLTQTTYKGFLDTDTMTWLMKVRANEA